MNKGDNELIVLEQIQHFVEMLDQYFGSVSELDLIFGFHKVKIYVLRLISYFIYLLLLTLHLELRL